MASLQIPICPLCQGVLEMEKPKYRPARPKVHGFCAEIGFSKGGWGMRQNFVSPFSDEICEDCFSVLAPIATALKEKMAVLRGSRAVRFKLELAAPPADGDTQGKEGA